MTRAAVATGLIALTLTTATQLHGSIPDEIRNAVLGQSELVALYEPGEFAPLWVTREGVPSSPAREALRLLRSADLDGLEPADYGIDELDAMAAELGLRSARSGLPARFDITLSAQALRYLRQIHMGRVDPRSVGFQLNVPRDGHDFPAVLREALRHPPLGEQLRAWKPQSSEYQALATALIRYRALAGREPDPVGPIVQSIHPGDAYADAALVRTRLVLLGDLEYDAGPSLDGVYGGAVVDGVVRFQRRHGLEPDGVLGRRTAEELAVPISWRVRQIELAMERLRWLPHESRGRLILVNIPMFRALAWDVVPPAGAPSFSTGVIVGRAALTETPVFSAELTEILFRPYWNVPTSIVRKEILPKLAREPDYLMRERMELVNGQGDASPVVPDTPENRALLRTGAVRLRQQPGPENSLGLIKFSFPNENDVYMHATPAQKLFARSRRDFSHGCVRVEDPVGLAEWVLREQPGWDRAAITAAMAAADSSRVIVRPPVRVMLLYSTAAAVPASNEVLFASDIYGHDERLDRALRLR